MALTFTMIDTFCVCIWGLSLAAYTGFFSGGGNSRAARFLFSENSLQNGEISVHYISKALFYYLHDSRRAVPPERLWGGYYPLCLPLCTPLIALDTKSCTPPKIYFKTGNGAHMNERGDAKSL